MPTFKKGSESATQQTYFGGCQLRYQFANIKYLGFIPKILVGNLAKIGVSNEKMLEQVISLTSSDEEDTSEPPPKVCS